MTIDIDNNAHEISASIIAGSIGTSEIADANVTKEKLSASVQASLDKADNTSNLVGNKSVTAQINEAMKDFEIETTHMVENGNERPVTSGGVYSYVSAQLGYIEAALAEI